MADFSACGEGTMSDAEIDAAIALHEVSQPRRQEITVGEAST
jgi:hypothetical protein